VSFSGLEWLILGRMTEANEEAWELAEEVCSVRIVELWAMQEYRRGEEAVEEEAIVNVCVVV